MGYLVLPRNRSRNRCGASPKLGVLGSAAIKAVFLVEAALAACRLPRLYDPIFEAPEFERASEQYPDAVFGKVDTEAEQALAASFGITSIPTLMIIRDNVVLYAQPGALPEAALEELITKAREVDMELS